MEVTFRRAEESDIDELLTFMHEFYNFGQLPFDYDMAKTALLMLLGDNRLGYAWLINYEQEAIGYTVLTLGYSLEFHGRDAFVDELYIRSPFRRKGIGMQTLQFLEENSYTLGVNALHLEVGRDDLGAQAFYRKASFKDHNRYLMTKWLIE